MINGKLTDKSTGKPIATKVKFIDKDGKEHQSNSNSIDGVFQQVLPSGNEYRIILDGWLLDDDLRKLNIPDYNEYKEFGYEYKARKIEQGIILADLAFFKQNSNELNIGYEKVIEIIKDLNKSQKGIVFEVVLSTSDSYFKPFSKTEKVVVKGKTKFKKVTISTESQLLDLIEKRKQKFSEKLVEIGFNLKNVNFKNDLVIKKPMPKAKIKLKGKSVGLDDQFTNNLTIRIDRVMKF